MNRKVILFFFGVVFLNYLIGYSLDPSLSIKEYVHINYKSKQGLPQDSVLSIAQTKNGYLWLGDYQGVSRFDGVRFAPLEVPENTDFYMRTIHALFSDSRDDLWIATMEGLFRYDKRKLIRYTKNDGLNDTWVYSVAEDPSGNIWLGTHEGIAKWNGKAFTKYTPDQLYGIKYVHYISIDPDSTIWAGTQDGVLIFNNGNWKLLTEREGLADNAVWAIVRDTDGSHWIGTEGGLAHYKNGKFRTYTTADGLPSNIINCLTWDRDHNLWIGTEGGLARIQQNKIESYTSKEGLPRDAIWALYEDPEGSLWIGMNNGGLSRFSEGKVQVMGKAEGLTNDIVTSVYEDPDGIFWIGTDEGLNRIEKNQITQLTASDGLLSNYITSLLKDSQNNFWIGTMSGLNRISKNTVSTYTKKEGLLDHVIMSLKEDSQGRIWIATNNGLNSYFNGELITFNELRRGTVQDFWESPKSGMWIATRGGLFQFKGNNWKRYTRKEGLPTEALSTVYEDHDGTLWIGTMSSGLARFKNGKFDVFRSEDGLGVNSISALLEDAHGYLWITSHKGIMRIPKQQFNDYADKKLLKLEPQTFTTSDGLRNAECFDGMQPTIWKSKDGKIWVATLEGAAVIDPARIKKNPVPPPVLIEKMFVSGRPIDLHRARSLPPGSRNFDFEFAAFSFLAPEKVRFQYQLSGFDHKWIDAGTRRIAQFTNIPPGRYTFHVRACNNDGVWNQAGASFSFQLQPYFYQTWWFYVLTIFAIAFLIWRIHKFQVRRVLELERIRTRIASDLHDDIGAGLSQIAVISEAVRDQLQNSNMETTSRLHKVSETARDLMESMSDIVWAVNPSRDRVEDLVTRLRRFSTDIMSAANIDFEMNAPQPDSGRKLTPDLKRHIHLIVKECVNNIVKHSQATSATVEMKTDNGWFYCTIHDNGRGIPAGEAFEGNGLKTMKERARLLNGDLEIQSEGGKGTTVHLKAPLRNRFGVMRDA
jgi:ligand-binding sensor domain-containing protein/two-component sensor histidine kinase